MTALSSHLLEEIKALPAKYPQPRSAVMPALDLAQEELGYLTPEEFATGYANVESKKRFPHSHSLGCCGVNLQRNSNPSTLTYPD